MDLNDRKMTNNLPSPVSKLPNCSSPTVPPGPLLPEAVDELPNEHNLHI